MALTHRQDINPYEVPLVDSHGRRRRLSVGVSPGFASLLQLVLRSPGDE